MAPPTTTPRPCFTASSFAARSSKRLRRFHVQRPPDVAVGVGGDERSALQRQLEHRLERPVQPRVPGGVREVADHHAHRRVGRRGGAGVRPPPDAADDRQHGQPRATATRRRPMVRRIGSSLPSSSRRDRASASSTELRKRLRRRRVGAAGDQGIERLGHLGQLGVKRNGRALSTRLQLLERARRARLPDAPAQHVVEHQPERVHVGALVHLLPPGLLGRHVLHRAHHRADARQVDVVEIDHLARGGERQGGSFDFRVRDPRGAGRCRSR